MANAGVESMFPLDKNRKLISERRDPDGATYKTFKLFAPDGDTIDIEVEVREPKPNIRPLETNRKIIAQEMNAEGYLNKLMMTEVNGEVKEYWIEEKIPKRKMEGDSKESPNKKLKDAGDASDRNTLEMLQSVVNRKPYPPSDQFLLMLAKTKVEEVDSVLGSDIITVEHHESLPSAFKKLIDHNILSVPVLLKDNTYFGFLDILDILNWVVDLVGEEALKKEDLDFHNIDMFKKATVAQVMRYPISKKNPFKPFPVGTSLLSALEELARGTHRVPVINVDGQLVNILTQSSVLRFIRKNMELLGDKRIMPLEHMYLSNQYVLSVNESEKAIDAFRLIKLAGVGAVAVVNDDGKLVGNCSARDLKKISSTSRFLSRLFRPLNEYLKDQREITFARKEETLETVVNRIVEKNLHRIYILDDDMQPEGLLSLKDILEELLKTS